MPYFSKTRVSHHIKKIQTSFLCQTKDNECCKYVKAVKLLHDAAIFKYGGHFFEISAFFVHYYHFIENNYETITDTENIPQINGIEHNQSFPTVPIYFLYL